MYNIIGFIVLCLFARAVHGGKFCSDISGTWRNQLGSNMTLSRLTETELYGDYSSAVETKKGASSSPSKISGSVAHLPHGALFAFTVLFNHGKSLTTWVGQCMVCDGEEVLFTTWALSSYQAKPVDRWMSNIINQDTFKRFREGSGNDIPRHMKMAGPPEKRERSLDCEQNLRAGDSGFWASESDAVQFSNCYESEVKSPKSGDISPKSGILSGKHQGRKLYGRSASGESFTALGLVSSSSQQAKGWSGHIYEKSRENGRQYISSWLTHSFSDSCKNPRASVRHGVDGYAYDVSYVDAEVTEETDVTDENPAIARRVLEYVWSFFS